MSRKKPKTASLETLIQGRHLLDPGGEAIRTAVNYFRQQEARKPLRSNLFQVLFDSFAEPLPAGVRAVSTADRRLLVAFDRPGLPAIQVDLQIRQEANDRAVVVGQVLPPLEGGSARLVEGSEEKAHSSTGDTGEFVLDYSGTGGGAVHLELRCADSVTPWTIPGILVSADES